MGAWLLIGKLHAAISKQPKTLALDLAVGCVGIMAGPPGLAYPHTTCKFLA
jgi:hypothetical protein